MRGAGLFFCVGLCALSAFASPPRLSVHPSAVVLGKDSRVEVRVEDVDGKLFSSASVGKLLEVEQSGDTHSFVWTPPQIRYPMTAVLIFWTSVRDPEVAIARIPLVGRTDLQVTTEPHAEVRVRVEGETFGPVSADARGKAVVPIEVPPNVTRATVLAKVGASQSERGVPIDVPSVNPLAVALSTDPVPKSGGAVVIVAHARSLEGAKLSVAARDADLEPLDSNAERALYRLTPTGSAASVTVTASLAGDERSNASVTAEVSDVALPNEGPDGAATVVPFGAVGGFYGGGANAGPALVLGASVPLDRYVPGLFLEAEVSARTEAFTGNIENLGRLESRVTGVPLLAAARYRFLRRGAWALDLRAGVGALFFTHSLRSNFQPSFEESGVRPDGLVALAASWRLPSFEPFAEVRGGWGVVQTAHVDARLGGVFLTVGVRYPVR